MPFSFPSAFCLLLSVSEISWGAHVPHSLPSSFFPISARLLPISDHQGSSEKDKQKMKGGV